MKTARQFHIDRQVLFHLFLIGATMLGITALLTPSNPGVAYAANGVPRPDHVVIVMEENHHYSQIIGDVCCIYINTRAAAGALMTNSHGVTHPSEPNYLQFFSGSNQGVTDDSCPHTYTTANLGQELIAAGFTFGSYSENLPAVGSTVCTASGGYARKHNPWVDFSNIPTSTNMPFTSFPTDFTQLPTISIIVPNLCNDMHDCSPATGDGWLQNHLDAYVQWAKTHNSLFILTFDEDNRIDNQIATIFEGPMVNPGQYNENINHHNILRTIEDMYNLPYAGESANVAPITDIWVGAPATPTVTATPSLTNTPTNTIGASPTRTPTSTPTHSAKIVSFQNGVLPGAGYAGTYDTVIKQAAANSNYGSTKILDVDGDDGGGSDKSVLIKWNLPTIPVNAIVTKATLTFWVVNPSGNSYRLYTMKRGWVGYQSTWNVFAKGQKWQIPGAFGANDRGDILGIAGPTANIGYYTITLNASGLGLVQSWINHPGTNFGLIIASTTSLDGLDFSSSEASTPTHRPRLTITYH
jgi:hypothetical protein